MYEMNLKMNPSAANIAAAADLAKPAVQKLFDTMGEAAAPLYALTQSEEPPTPAQLVEAIASLRDAADSIKKLEYQVLGVAVLGGAAVTTTARKVGVRPTTLSENLASTRAVGRGRPMSQLPDGTWVNV